MAGYKMYSLTRAARGRHMVADCNIAVLFSKSSRNVQIRDAARLPRKPPLAIAAITLLKLMVAAVCLAVPEWSALAVEGNAHAGVDVRGTDGETVRGISSSAGSAELSDWKLLNFYTIVPSDKDHRPPASRRIKELEITLFERRRLLVGFANAARVTYRTNDRRVLDAVEEFLRHPLRPTTSPDWEESVGECFPIGQIAVTTNTEVFTISATTGGFVLGRREPELSTVFYSWGLAYFLDDVSGRKSQPRIPGPVLDKLSGESRMSRDREAFTRLRKLPLSEHGEDKERRR